VLNRRIVAYQRSLNGNR